MPHIATRAVAAQLPRSSESQELLVRLGAFALFAALTAALASGCATTSSNSRNASARPTSEWLQPSALLAQQIDDEAARLPWTHDLERVEQIRWFVSVGEPAYAKLLELARDPRDDVAAAAIAALGGTNDRRLVPHLRALPSTGAERARSLELERARALVSLGDWSALPVLIDGLRDDKLYTRTLCLQVLQRTTRQTLGYDPKAETDRREEAVLRWEGWWKTRNGEGLLASTQAAASANP